MFRGKTAKMPIIPELTGRTPAHTHISRPSLLFRLTLRLWYV